MSTESKVRIYKTNVRPVLAYASETRAETTCTQQLLRATEMKTIWAIHGKTLRDKIHSDQLRHLSGIQDIIKWKNDRRREWDAHAENYCKKERLKKFTYFKLPILPLLFYYFYLPMSLLHAFLCLVHIKINPLCNFN